MKYKKLLISALLTACGATSYAAVNYNAGTNYSKGQEVNNAGSCYVCDIPGWCSSSAAWAYAPGTGTAWQQAWTEGCENPGPSPEPTTEKTISVKLSGDSLPADAKIEFSANGKSYTVTNNQVTLPYSDSQTINYAITATNGSISPNSFAMTKDSSSINLTYTKQPAPVPGKCDTIPKDVKEFIPNGQGGFWGGYSKGAFVKFDGSIYQLLNDYWTSASPADSSAWVLCEAIVQAQVNIKTTGLPQAIDKVDIKIGSQTYTINPNNPTPITVAKGSYDVTVNSVLSSDGSKNYVAKTISPNPIVVNEETTEINLNVNFQAEDVKPANVSFNVKFPEGASPSKTVTAKRISSNGDPYGDDINLDNGSNTTTIPSKGEFTIKPESYEINGTNYNANSITVIDGKVQGDNTISYEIAGAWPEKSMVGYWGTWSWGQSPELVEKLSEFADYYNVIIPGFLKVSGTDVQGFYDAVNPEYLAKAIEAVHAKGALFIASTGGLSNTWNPTLSDDNTVLAKNIVNYLAENNMDGFDFDLEGSAIKGTAEWQNQIKDVITKMREYAESDEMKDKFPRGFYITAAPQTYVDTGVPANIYWT
ncbi:glycosyl hydrolase family 18 protein, partial [Francisella philomiragia]